MARANRTAAGAQAERDVASADVGQGGREGFSLFALMMQADTELAEDGAPPERPRAIAAGMTRALQGLRGRLHAFFLANITE